MIDLIRANKEFLKYAEKFDEEDLKIKMKKEHPFRVQIICKKIAESLNLTEEKIQLAMLIGILHDIGRFEQEKKSNTFDDFESFDHGDYGAKLLKKLLRNFIDITDYDNIIIEAVRNHNKLIIDENLNDEQKLFARIIRDADKIDIMYGTINLFYRGKEDIVGNSEISDYTFDFIKKHQQVASSKNVKIVYLDNIVRTIGFIFDINYQKSFEILKEQDYINRMIDRFNYKDKNTKKRIEEMVLR